MVWDIKWASAKNRMENVELVATEIKRSLVSKDRDFAPGQLWQQEYAGREVFLRTWEHQ